MFIFKKQNKKHIANFILTLLIIIGVGFILINKPAPVLSAESSQGTTQISCDKKIPIGEAIDETGRYVDPIFQELQAIHQIVPVEIQTAEAILKAIGPATTTRSDDNTVPKICDYSRCQPVCIDTSPYFDFYIDCSVGFHHIRITIFRWYGHLCVPVGYEKPCLGKPCKDIDMGAEIVNDTFNQINGHYQNVETQITKNTVTRTNILSKIGHYLMVKLHLSSMTKTEEIKMLLNKARDEFNKCSVSKEDWQKMTRGEITPISLERAQDVEKNGFSIPEDWIKDCQSGKCQNVCSGVTDFSNAPKKCVDCVGQCAYGSKLNWFCCH